MSYCHCLTNFCAAICLTGWAAAILMIDLSASYYVWVCMSLPLATVAFVLVLFLYLAKTLPSDDDVTV
jgi:heme/copper-type cytochrome/quinol oxidase subunit 4